jgi:hypothetical protein
VPSIMSWMALSALVLFHGCVDARFTLKFVCHLKFDVILTSHYIGTTQQSPCNLSRKILLMDERRLALRK